jgi:hypothetical protein
VQRTSIDASALGASPRPSRPFIDALALGAPHHPAQRSIREKSVGRRFPLNHLSEGSLVRSRRSASPGPLPRGSEVRSGGGGPTGGLSSAPVPWT